MDIEPTTPPKRPMKIASSSNRRMTLLFLVPKDRSRPISFFRSKTVFEIIKEVMAEEATREMIAKMIRRTEANLIISETSSIR